MKRITIIGVLIVFITVFPSYTQFRGGSDDGMGKGSSYGLPVEGNKTFGSVFHGGHHTGFTSSTNRLHLSGISPTGRFFGGLGDGTDQKLIMVTLSGADMKVLFSGGNAEGHDAHHFSVFPSGIAAGNLYSGGKDEGSSLSLYTNTLQDEIPIAMYAGGEDEGTSVQTGYHAIAAPNIDMFNGSFNDGHMHKYYKGLLDMNTYASIFQGGTDDGFYIEIQSVTLTNGSVGTPKNISTGELTIYPNPVTERFFYVKLWETYDINENLQLYLTSIEGKNIPIEIDLKDNAIKINYLIHLSKGAYILTIQSADSSLLKATLLVN